MDSHQERVTHRKDQGAAMTDGQGLGQWAAQGSSNLKLSGEEGSLERCRCSKTCPAGSTRSVL